MSTFESLGLAPNILSAVKKLGFTEPTQIQQEAIPVILSPENPDLIALAQTGTGKTAAFGLPLIQRIDTYNHQPQALVLSPTRELAIQITRDLADFAVDSPISIEAVYGGTPIHNQLRALRNGVQVIVGTPGRTLDLINRKALVLTGINYVVLDEADEMLNMGFKVDLDSILKHIAGERQTLLFSATMAPEVARIAKNYMKDPVQITVGTKNAGAKRVDHHFYQVPARERYEALKRILAMEESFYGIVFCRTRKDTEYVSRKLSKDGFPADALNGDLSQAQRDLVMERFRDKQITTLVATDVAARGLDVEDLSHVINYELPDDPEVYIHRSGRTGRAGKSGISIAIIHNRERYRVRDLERMSGKQFRQQQVPSGDKICQNRLLKRVESLQVEAKPDPVLTSFLPEINEKLEGLSREQLIERFFTLEFQDMLREYQGARDLNAPARESRDSRDFGNRRDARGSRNGARRENSSREGRETRPFRGEKPEGRVEYSGFIVNIGEKHRVSVNRLMGIINDHMMNRHMRIGKVRILPQSAYFEVERQYEGSVIPSLNGVEVDGRNLKVSRSEGFGREILEKTDTWEKSSKGKGDKKKKARKRARKKNDKV